MPYDRPMSKRRNVGASLDAETLGALDRLAEHFGCSREHLVATAVMRFINDEIDAITEDPFADIPPYRTPQLDWEAIDKASASLRAFLKVGEDAIERGDVVSHDVVMAELKALDDEALAKKKRAA